MEQKSRKSSIMTVVWETGKPLMQLEGFLHWHVDNNSLEGPRCKLHLQLHTYGYFLQFDTGDTKHTARGTVQKREQ
jgi:hypothetical protein